MINNENTNLEMSKVEQNLPVELFGESLLLQQSCPHGVLSTPLKSRSQLCLSSLDSVVIYSRNAHGRHQVIQLLVTHSTVQASWKLGSKHCIRERLWCPRSAWCERHRHAPTSTPFSGIARILEINVNLPAAAFIFTDQRGYLLPSQRMSLEVGTCTRSKQVGQRTNKMDAKPLWISFSMSLSDNGALHSLHHRLLAKTAKSTMREPTLCNGSRLSLSSLSFFFRRFSSLIFLAHSEAFWRR